jgi:hypothetical protein
MTELDMVEKIGDAVDDYAVVLMTASPTRRS